MGSKNKNLKQQQQQRQQQQRQQQQRQQQRKTETPGRPPSAAPAPADGLEAGLEHEAEVRPPGMSQRAALDQKEAELRQRDDEIGRLRKDIQERGLRRQELEKLEAAHRERTAELEAEELRLLSLKEDLEHREKSLTDRIEALRALEAEARENFQAQEAAARQAWFVQRTHEVESALEARQAEVEELLQRQRDALEDELRLLREEAERETRELLEGAQRRHRKAQEEADLIVEEAQARALDHQKRAREQSTQALESWQANLHAREDALRTRETELVDREGDLTRREQLLRRRERTLEEDEALLTTDRKRLREREESLQTREQACSGEALGRLQAEKEMLEQKLKVYFEENLKLRQTLEDRNRLLEAGSPEELLQQNTRLRAQLDEQQRRLENLPSELELAQLRREAQASVDFEARCRDLEAQLSLREREKRERERERVELETLRRERDTFRLVNDHLTGQKEELERLLGELKSRKGDVFGNFTRIAGEDGDDKESRQDGQDLKALADRARAWMWHLPSRHQLDAGQARETLFAHYYEAHVVRAFVASLAASRLLILQGVSGTGKTSLPEYFAHATGGRMTRVEVQSSWRDRSDLMGFYNAFYRQFNESPFARALFEANTRQYRNRPYFIVLDEANLSRIEYYFADLLSIMEGRPEDRQIELLNHDPTGGNLPEGLVPHNGAVRLRIPPNVWFICTANTDESTYEITRKVYDRAQVLQLDETPEPGRNAPSRGDVSLQKVGLDAFSRGVQAAVRSFEPADRDKTQEVLDHVRQGLRQHFGVNYGQRLLDQLFVFLPVYVAAGGKPGPGLDHFIARKLLWQVTNRTDPNVRKGLEVVLNDVQEAFGTAGLGSPSMCEALLSREIERFRR